MFKSLLRDQKLILLLLLAAIVKVWALKPAWVERYYTYGAYPYISRTLRFLFGWLPFSFGDLVYLTAGVYLLVKAYKYGRIVKTRQVKTYLVMVVVKKFLYLVLIMYILFNVLWGLNYNRIGIAGQLALDVQPYSTEDLTRLTAVLQQRMNFYAGQIDTVQRAILNQNAPLFAEGIATYAEAEKKHSFLSYSCPSLKPSMYTHIGHFIGFTGYYNPFSGEAQLKTSIPVFLKPFVVNHEMAHQLGYGKENEANFVSFLAGRESLNKEVRYSTYFEMCLYAIRDLRRKDSVAAGIMMEQWHPQVKRDYDALTDYLLRSVNPVEPFFSQFYDRFLKMNNQPKGTRTYSEVVAWLIAYLKKYGEEAI